MPGERLAQGFACQRKTHEGSHHRSAETIRHSPRDGVTVSFVLSPEIGLCVSVAPEKHWLLENLVPASRHQDHTTSPSASLAFVLRQAKASTAPRAQRS